MKKLLLLAAFAACRPAAPPMASEADAARGHVDVATLEEGRSLLVRKCGGACHKVPLPSQHTAAEWPVKLDEMSTRAGLAPGQRQLIEQYLVTMAPR